MRHLYITTCFAARFVSTVTVLFWPSCHASSAHYQWDARSIKGGLCNREKKLLKTRVLKSPFNGGGSYASCERRLVVKETELLFCLLC